MEQLRQSEENYRGLFENATGAIEVHDLNGRIIAANRAFEKLTGYSGEELTKLDATRFLAPKDVKSGRGDTEERSFEETRWRASSSSR